MLAQGNSHRGSHLPPAGNVFWYTGKNQCQQGCVPTFMSDLSHRIIKRKTNTLATTQEKGSGEISILTYNVWGMPGPLAQDRRARLQRLGETLSAYDIVTLQEAFSDDIRHLESHPEFPFQIRHDNRGLVRAGSGLYILSKHEILKADYRPFSNCTQGDCLARKGVLWVRIEHPTIGLMDIYTTHYQSQTSTVAADIREKEDNRVLQEFVHQNNAAFPVLITGDFNLLPDQREYRDLMRRLPLIDLYRNAHPDNPGMTFDPLRNPYARGGTPGRIDYIFLLKGNAYEATPLACHLTHEEEQQGYYLSDHFGVTARIYFRQAGPAKVQALKAAVGTSPLYPIDG